MFSAKQGNYWYHFLYDAVLDWGLNPGPPALEASTIPLGNRGGGTLNEMKLFLILYADDQVFVRCRMVGVSFMV